jgi:hypothetical protein
VYAEQQLRDLIVLARKHGKKIDVTIDEDILRKEGTVIIETVKITGIGGVGPYPMSGFAAYECLLEAKAAGLLGPVIRGCQFDARIGRVFANLSNSDRVALIDLESVEGFDLGSLQGRTTAEATELLARHAPRTSREQHRG